MREETDYRPNIEKAYEIISKKLIAIKKKAINHMGKLKFASIVKIKNEPIEYNEDKNEQLEKITSESVSKSEKEHFNPQSFALKLYRSSAIALKYLKLREKLRRWQKLLFERDFFLKFPKSKFLFLK